MKAASNNKSEKRDVRQQAARIQNLPLEPLKVIIAEKDGRCNFLEKYTLVYFTKAWEKWRQSRPSTHKEEL